MKAPLRKVVDCKLVHRGTTLSKRGRTVTMTNYYDTRFVLECGHRIELRGSSFTQVASKRCNECAKAIAVLS